MEKQLDRSPPPRPRDLPTRTTISGKITLPQSDTGISDLVVEVLHVAEAHTVARLGSVCTDRFGGFRLEVASPTAQGGSWWQRPRPSWDLQLAVLAAEGPDADRCERLLFLSQVRERAGTSEHFRIELPRDALEAAGIDFEKPDAAAAGFAAEGITEAHARQAKVQKAIDDVFGSTLETVEARRALFRGDVLRRLTEELSEVSDKERDSGRYVPTADDIAKVHIEAVKADVVKLTEKEATPESGESEESEESGASGESGESGGPASKFRLTGRLSLSDAQREALTGGSEEPVTLTEAQVEEKLGTSLDKPPVIYRTHLEPDPCRPRTDAEHCLDDIDPHAEDTDPSDGEPGPDGNDVEPGGDDVEPGGDDVEPGGDDVEPGGDDVEPGGDDVEPGDDTEPDGDDTESGGGDNDGTPVVFSSGRSDTNGNQGGGGVTFDQDRAVANVMRRQTAPEDPVEFGAEGVAFEQPLTAGGVSSAIDQVMFAPGPADVPSFHDFHDLQIAFEPVWQEALDDKFLEDVEAAYDRFVERGGAPALDRIGAIVAANLGGGFFNAFLDGLFDIGTAGENEVPAAVASMVLISLEEWRILPPPSRSHLSLLATRVATRREKLIAAIDPDNIPDIDLFNIGDLLRAANNREAIAVRAQIQLLTTDAERIVAHARRLILEREANEPFRPTHAIIERLRHRRNQGYPFRFFAASAKHRSVNFGLVVTYRQKWVPTSYQVGELVDTIPLAPKEVRRYSKRTAVTTKRAQKEIESNLISRRGESEEKSRAEAQIVSRAEAKTNFSLTNTGTVSIGGEEAIGGSATTTSTFSREAQKHSESIKKEFREAILKSAEEYKNERKIEVSTEESFEEEVTESGEIQNPNDEIPVTFLFYELQRRFRVSEKIHRLQSVVLVAQEVPLPSAIDTAWVIRHDWILNRVLLDDSFRPALTYVSTTLVSEETALKDMRQALFRQRKLVEELKEDLADRRALAGLRYAALQRQIERTAQSADSGGGLLGGLGDIVGGIPVAGDLIQGGLDLITGGGGPSEEAQIREGAARDAFDRERREEQDLASRVQNALSTLDSMQRAYTERLAQHLRELTQCERLLTHLSQNILHYMQAIWAHEPDDQRFLRLRNVPVPIFRKDKARRRYVLDPGSRKMFFTGIKRPSLHDYEVSVDLGIDPPPSDAERIETKPLSEVADLNRPLGFKGNYLIFPLVESNPITEFMMDPYVTVAEGEYGVADPDPLGNMTLEEFSDYVCCLRKHFAEEAEDRDRDDGDRDDGDRDDGDRDDEEEPDDRAGDDVGGDDVASGGNRFDELKPFLRETLKRLLELSLRNDEEIVVPCDCLYIEALPGAHSIMEKFKHLHRQIDVKQAQSELRTSELESIRRAARILGDDLEDPDIEAKYVFEGGGSATIVPPGGPGAGDPDT